MIQQINLYQGQDRKARPPFAAVRIAQALAVALVLLVSATGLLHWQKTRQSAQIVQLRADLEQQKQQIAALEVQFPPPKEDPTLVAAVGRLEQELGAKTRFVENFGSGQLGNAEGFSAGLTALARHPLEGLWLREMHFQGDGRVALLGSTVDAARVPALVSALTREPVFLGRQFRTLSIKRDDKAGGHLQFSLQSAGVLDSVSEKKR